MLPSAPGARSQTCRQSAPCREAAAGLWLWCAPLHQHVAATFSWRPGLGQDSGQCHTRLAVVQAAAAGRLRADETLCAPPLLCVVAPAGARSRAQTATATAACEQQHEGQCSGVGCSKLQRMLRWNVAARRVAPGRSYFECLSVERVAPAASDKYQKSLLTHFSNLSFTCGCVSVRAHTHIRTILKIRSYSREDPVLQPRIFSVSAMQLRFPQRH